MYSRIKLGNYTCAEILGEFLHKYSKVLMFNFKLKKISILSWPENADIAVNIG